MGRAMNIRPMPGKLAGGVSQTHHPLTQARFATPKSCHGCSRARVPNRRPSAQPKDNQAMPIRRRREKVFGPGRAVPLDRNAKARIAAYARAWSARNRQPRQHRGPITRAFLDVLGALLWGFHNSRIGGLLPVLRVDRGQGGVRPQHGCRGAEGAGVGRRADAGSTASPASWCASATYSGNGRLVGR